MTWFLYMLRCADGSLYTGITNDLLRRCKQHDAGTASRYTRSRRPAQLVYQEPHASKSLALRREAAVKALSRQEKIRLISRRKSMRSYSLLMMAAVLAAQLLVVPAQAQTVDDWVRKSQAALTEGRPEEALELTGKAIAADSKNARAYLIRGRAHEALQHHEQALADFDAVLRLDPQAAEAYNHRGSEHFKLGHIAASLADFDKFLELRPDQYAGHWQRGISCYYAGRFAEGQRQFAGYEKVDTNDVENAVWHYLCAARVAGRDKARESLLKIGNDKRVPMMQVYALFRGTAKPEDILQAARAGNPPAERLRQQLFYAHLYLGLYYESTGDEQSALEQLSKAADNAPARHYMGDVARVHRDLLRKSLEKSRQP